MNVYKTDYRLNEKAQQLCEKLYLAAKKSKTRRFHQLYDKVYRMDILYDSWNIVKQNKGCAGVDGMKITDVLKYGQDKYLQELHELLLDTHQYHPRKIKRVYIPKTDGKQRPLGIPAIRDRIVQTATKTLLEPIFEADFFDCSYGFRPNRSAHQAIEEIRVWTNKGFKFVLDADDFVILFATREDAELGLKLVKSQLMRLGLELNEKKSKIVDLRQGKEGFDFLGFHTHRVKSRKYRKHFTQRWPSVRAMKSVRQKIRRTFWTRDFNHEAYRKSGVQILSGNVTYWQSKA